MNDRGMNNLKIFFALAGIIGAVLILVSTILPPLGYTSADAQQQSKTPIPTLTPVPEATVQGFNDLVADSECTLPCWWGLTLQETNIDAVEQWFRNNFGESNILVVEGDQYTAVSGSLTVIEEDYPEPWLLEEMAYNFSLTARAKGETDELIQINLRIPLPQYHRIDWTPLAPESILAIYGEPDEITYLGSVSYGGCCSHIVFRYFELGLYIDYSITTTYSYTTTYSDGKDTFCNTLENLTYDGILLWAETEELELSSFGLWKVTRYGATYETNIENVTGMTISEFTELFSKEGTCVTTLPLEEWSNE